jgi:hypothetical protein
MEAVAGTVTAEESESIFNRFVFHGEWVSRERVEQAVRAVQRQLGSAELRRINDALLARLAQAKQAHGGTPKRELLDDPGISSLVNTLALVNQAWITTVISRNIRGRKHLHGFSPEELYSTALTGAGAVGGVMNAILQYDYNSCGVDAFTHYLAKAITNALLPTPKEKMTYRRVNSRMRSIQKHEEDRAEQSWVDRTTPPPEAVALNRELIEIVQSVIPRLPTAQQRVTARWMIDRILNTGELPMAREAAKLQWTPVSRERGRQIMEKTIDSIRRKIEEEYPQLAEQGVNGWEEFRKAFDRPSPAHAR